MSLDALGELIGGTAGDKERMKSQMILPGQVTTRFIFGHYRLKTTKTELKIEEQTIGSSFILDHATNAELGTSLLGAATKGSASTLVQSFAQQSFADPGKNEVGKWLNSETAVIPNRFAFGTGTTAFNEADTTLGSESFRFLVQTWTIGTAASGSVLLTLTGTLPSTASPTTITEYGAINGDSGGSLFTRETFTSISTVQTKEYPITLKFTLADATTGRGLITNAGLQQLGYWIGFSSVYTPVAPTQMAWASGTTNPAYTDTTLESEDERNAFTVQSRVNNVVKFETILAASEADTDVLAKSGVFNASSGGNLYIEQKYPSFTKSTLFQVYETDAITIV